jgi:lipopolysaccharide export system ATP-binding protein
MAYLAQEPTIFKNLSVSDNLRLVMEQTAVPRSLRNQLLEQLLQEFHLTEIANSQGYQVSGGQRRRTEIARSLAIGVDGPKFLLLDEPFAGIDPIVVSEIQTIMARLKHKGMGILITDHNVRETLAVIDRGYIMRDGEIFASGSSRELSENPEVRRYYLGENFRL